jgi:hypothetical protein
VAKASTFRNAEAKMVPLVPFFKVMTQEEAQALADAAVKNDQIWKAVKCQRDYLPKFIAAQGKHISRTTLRALKYQIENDEFYGTKT